MNEDTVRPEYDFNNPPLTGNEKMIPAREMFLKRYAEIEAQIAARKWLEQRTSHDNAGPKAAE